MKKTTFIATNNVVMNYRYYCPNSTNKLPVVFYLHGAGQRGTDNSAQLDVGAGSLMAISMEKDEYNAIIIAPQCPNQYYWRDDNMLDALTEFINIMTLSPIVDTNRIYVTGYSMGGDASWKLALKCPNLLTTVMPICGGPLENMEPDRPIVKEETAKLNIWAFNNFDDMVVRPNYSKYMFSKIWSYNINDNLNFTENVEGGHDATAIYRNRKYMIWLLSTNKKN